MNRFALFLLVLAFAPTQARAAAPAIDPAGLPGPIVLVGGRELPADARTAFFDLAGKEKAKIVVIPTAIATADDPKTTGPLVKEWEELKPASVVLLHTRDPKKANDPDFVKPLANATGVWFANGHTDRILNAYRGTLFEKELRKLHARGGVIGCAGGGAGAMGSLAFSGGAKEPVAALNFLPGFLIDNKERLAAAVESKAGSVGIHLPEGAAVVIRGRVARVIGEKAITVVVAKGAGKMAVSDEYNAGSLLDLVQLRRAAANRAAKAPFPPAKPPVPEVVKGTLFIIGGGGSTPEMWERFIKASGGPDALIVVIPTAMDDPLGPVSGEERVLKKYGAKNVKTLHTRDPRKANDPKFSEMLTKAGGVWFGGGRQWRFVDAYAGTLTEKRFHEVLDRGGAIGGSSAGASIQSEYMPRGHP
ncbi:MAG TPA: Type 1 glutamine amidotransferase-like domain-containing protein, partial [Gemmata sp.]|nr:Type 1 glutamine amidotransferase-like domain-containing protein [Gemmata sp.]